MQWGGQWWPWGWSLATRPPSSVRTTGFPGELPICCAADAVLWICPSSHLMITSLVIAGGLVQARCKEWSSDCGSAAGGCRLRIRPADGLSFWWSRNGVDRASLRPSTTCGITGKEGATRVWKGCVDVAGGKEGDGGGSGRGKSNILAFPHWHPSLWREFRPWQVRGWRASVLEKHAGHPRGPHEPTRAPCSTFQAPLQGPRSLPDDIVIPPPLLTALASAVSPIPSTVVMAVTAVMAVMVMLVMCSRTLPARQLWDKSPTKSIASVGTAGRGGTLSCKPGYSTVGARIRLP